MLQLVLYGLLAVILAAGLFGLAARFLPAGEQIAPALRDEPPWDLPPDRVLHPEDVDSVRLPVALRGYRFAETDILLDRLASELRARDDEIARLRGHAPVLEEPEPDGSAPDPAEPAAEVPVVAWAPIAPSTPWSNPPPWAVAPAPEPAEAPAAEPAADAGPEAEAGAEPSNAAPEPADETPADAVAAPADAGAEPTAEVADQMPAATKARRRTRRRRSSPDREPVPPNDSPDVPGVDE